MSAYGDNPDLHRLVDESFVCTAPADAPCRTSPTCDCENWCGCDGSPEDAADNHGTDHCCMQTTAPGQGCWIELWVNGSDLEGGYSGSHELADLWFNGDGELIWPDGPVTVDWEDEYCTWKYADYARPVVSPAALEDPRQPTLPLGGA